MHGCKLNPSDHLHHAICFNMPIRQCIATSLSYVSADWTLVCQLLFKDDQLVSFSMCLSTTHFVLSWTERIANKAWRLPVYRSCLSWSQIRRYIPIGIATLDGLGPCIWSSSRRFLFLSCYGIRISCSWPWFKEPLLMFIVRDDLQYPRKIHCPSCESTLYKNILGVTMYYFTSWYGTDRIWQQRLPLGTGCESLIWRYH